MAATITVSGKFTGYTHSLTVDVESQDSVANTTTVSYSYNLHREVSKAHGDIVTANNVTFHAFINGVDNSATPNFNMQNLTDFEVLSGEQTLNNQLNGTLSFTVELKTAGKSGSAYLKAADKTATFVVDSVDRSSTFVVSPQPVASGDTFDVAISALDPSFTHNVYMIDSSDTQTTIATGVSSDTTGTAPTLAGGIDSDIATIRVDTLLSGVVIGSKLGDLLIWSAADNPPVNLQTPFDFRFRRMIRTGSTIVPNEIIPFTAGNFTDTYSDTGTCSLTTNPQIYPADLDKAVVFAEVFNGTAWVNTGMLFSLTRVENDAVDVTGAVTYSGTAYVDFLLGKAVLPNNIKYSSKVPGYILRGNVDSAHLRGWGPLVSSTFTATKTSPGSAWSSKMSQEYDAGTPLLQIMQSFVEGVYAEYRVGYDTTAGKALIQVYNTGYGYDWTLPSSKTVINLKTQGVTRVVTQAPVQKDYSGMLTSVTATGATTNKKVKVRNPKTGRIDTETKSSTLMRTKTRTDLINPLYGQLEARVDASGVTSATTLTAVADSTIVAGNRPIASRQFTYETDSQDITPALYPYRVFRPGDWIWVPGNDGVIERDRIQQLVVSRDSDGITVQITTGDLLPTGATSLYRYLRRSTGNAKAGGVMTTTPADASVIIPSAVTNLVATPLGSFATTGIATSAIGLTWDEVTTDDDGNDLLVPSYQILTRADYTDTWATVATAEETVATLPSFNPGTTLDVAVVPVADDGTIGNPDDYITVTTPDPDAMTGSPTDPTLSVDAIGNVSIGWDGLMSGIAPSPEFSFVRAEISADGVSAWSPAGSQLSTAGNTTVQDVGAGTWYFHLVPVDTLGRSGTPSGVEFILVSPVLGDTRVPKAPTDLAVTSEGNWDQAEPSSSVTATWTAVTEATDNTAMTIITYELWGRLTGDPAYTFLTSVVGTDTTATYNDIGPLGSSWDFVVRATGSNIVQSDFSTSVTTTVVVPALVLDPPTAPVLGTFRGLLLVSWDGNLVDSSSNAYLAPAFLANVDIWVSVDAGTTYTRQGFLSAGTRTQSVSGLGVGADILVTLVAVDRLGQATSPSASAEIVITGIDGGDITANTLDANAIITGSLTVDKVSPTFGSDLDISGSDSINILAGNIGDVAETAGTTADGLAAMQTRYSFTPTAAIISQPGSAFSVSISNTELDFNEAGIARAYLNAGVFYAPKLSSQEIALTHHIIEDDPAGAGTIIKRF